MLGSRPGATHRSVVERALSAQAAAVLGPGKLPTKDKLLLLAATCCARRDHGPARQAVRLAKKAGATVPEIEEVLLACFASRGPLVYLEARAALRALLKERPSTRNAREKQAPAASSSATLEKFLGYFGSLPLWVKALAQNHPALIEGHQLIRELVFADGHARRKLKELVFVAINCSDRYDYGIKLHTQAAATAGASEAEILETIALSVLGGGIVAWIEGVHHYLGKGEQY